jgi:hypothetical protein
MVRTGVLTPEAALPYATNAGNLLLRLGELGGSTEPPETPPKADDSMLDMIER